MAGDMYDSMYSHQYFRHAITLKAFCTQALEVQTTKYKPNHVHGHFIKASVGKVFCFCLHDCLSILLCARTPS